MRSLTIIIALVAGWLASIAPVAQARRDKDEVVIYADFNYINAVATSQKYVYFATTNGIIVYNKLEHQWELPLTGADGIDSENIQRIWVDRFDQSLCAATAAGLYQYDSLAGEWSPIPELPHIQTDDQHVRIPAIMPVPPGFNFMPGGSFADGYGRSFPIHDMVDDGTGTVWIGTWGFGPAKAETISSPVEFLPYGLLQNPSYTLHSDDSVLWIGGPILASFRTGVTALDRVNNSFKYVESGTVSEFPQNDVNCIETDSASVYLGTAIGLLVCDRTSYRVVSRRDQNGGLPDDHVTCLKKVGDSLYVGTDAGLVVLGASLDSVGYVAPDEFLNKIIYDLDVVDDYLWIASEVGAYRLSLTTGKLQRFQDPDQVLFHRVYTVRHWKRSVWLASDAGAVKLDIDTGTTKPYRIVCQQFESRAMAANDRILAISSDRGFTLIYLDEKNSRTREFSVDDGLPSTHVFSLLLDGDYLWIGTELGVCRFWWNNPYRID